MRSAFTAAVFALSLAASAVAQGVRGPAEITVPVGRLASVPLTVDGDESDYAILGSDCDAFREYDPDPKRIRLRVIGYKAGAAWVTVASVKAGKLSPLFVCRITITGGVDPGPGPRPDPGPDPKPDPQPDPVGPQKLYVVVVEETEKAAYGRAAFLGDPRLAKKFPKDGSGHTWRVVDQDVIDPDGKTPADVARFVAEAKAKGVPRLFLVSEKGKTLLSAPMPDTVDALLVVLTKFGG